MLIGPGQLPRERFGNRLARLGTTNKVRDHRFEPISTKLTSLFQRRSQVVPRTGHVS